MTNWLIGGAFGAMLIAVIVELAINYRKGWEEDGKSQGKQVNTENLGQKSDPVS
ncbi:MAG: hypothetical protein HQ567_24815 [Candidatus Nealsonbacteria bacterium]|nr:hypothetical protein [Candidatus Nealsonbacteria bacterium]